MSSPMDRGSCLTLFSCTAYSSVRSIHRSKPATKKQRCIHKHANHYLDDENFGDWHAALACVIGSALLAAQHCNLYSAVGRDQ